MQLLPRQLYLRFSAPLQALSFCAFTGLYFLEPSLETRQALIAPENRLLLHCLPSYWFLGVLQQLNGASFQGFAPLAHRAWVGLTCGCVLATVAMFAAYVRNLPRLVEQPDILPEKRQRLLWPRRLAPLQAAIMYFLVRTLFRSRQHRLIASFYLGVGVAAALAYASTALGNVSVPHALRLPESRQVLQSTTIVLMCVAIAAIRLVFAMPVALRANWIFRITPAQAVFSYKLATRRTLLLMSVAPSTLCIAIVLFAVWPWRLALLHTVALALFGGALAEWSLFRFQKLPFTCSYLPGRANGHIVFWVTVLLLIPTANEVAHAELRLMGTVGGWALLTLLPGAAWASGVWQNSKRDALAPLKFEEVPAPDVASLKLDRNRYAAAAINDNARSM